jgi:hypothetical protein
MAPPPQEKLRPEEVRREFIRNSSPLARVVALYIRVEAKKPVSINRWALERDGQSQWRNRLPRCKGGGRLFVFGPGERGEKSRDVRRVGTNKTRLFRKKGPA